MKGGIPMVLVKSALNLTKIYFYCGVVFFLVCLGPSLSYSKGIVAGKFLSAKGNKIVLQLTIKSDFPLSIIVEQLFTAANQTVETRPTAKKITANGKKIKWLLKKKQNETIKLRTRLSQPLKGKVKAIIRYRSPKNGKLMETKISS